MLEIEIQRLTDAITALTSKIGAPGDHKEEVVVTTDVEESLGVVRAALIQYGEDDSQEKAVDLMRRIGGSTRLSEVKPAKYQELLTAVAMATKKLKKQKKKARA